MGPLMVLLLAVAFNGSTFAVDYIDDLKPLGASFTFRHWFPFASSPRLRQVTFSRLRLLGRGAQPGALDSPKVEGNAWLVANHPRVVSLRCLEAFTGPDGGLLTVRSPDTHPTRDYVSDVTR